MAQDIYRSWALPGGVGAERWWVAESLERFLVAAGASDEAALPPSLTVEPAAALVKGTDGPGWTTVCVLHRVTARLQDLVEQVALGHCERMQWVGGRWMIAPGDAPAPAPATWPDTPLAAEAGWRPWVSTMSSEMWSR